LEDAQAELGDFRFEPRRFFRFDLGTSVSLTPTRCK